MDIEKLSRRSFLKKTTVLAVGVASVSLFSGLVDAQTIYIRLCHNPQEIGEYLDTFTQNGKNTCWTAVRCNGFEAVLSQRDCPNPTDGDKAYAEWLICASNPAKRISDHRCTPV